MAAITHATVATAADDPNVEINKAEWNASHVVSGIVNADIDAGAAIVGSKLDLTAPGPIGGTTPNTGNFTSLQVYGSGTQQIKITADDDNRYQTIIENNWNSSNPFNLKVLGSNILVSTNSNSDNYVNGSNSVGLDIDNVQKLTVLYNGKVGIGTTSPTTQLHIAGTDVQTSGTGAVGLTVAPTYNQSSGTAANTDLLINRTETAIGSGTQRLISAGTGGGSYAEKWGVDNLGRPNHTVVNTTATNAYVIKGGQAATTANTGWVSILINGVQAWIPYWTNATP